MKKILATALAFALTLGIFALPVTDSGVCITDKFAISAIAKTYGKFEYKELDDGTIEIVKYSGNASYVDIPSTIDEKPVTSIGNSAFASRSNLTYVNIPSSVTNIKSCAFYCSFNLVSVTISSNVTNIGSSAFSLCNSLKNISVNSDNEIYTSEDGVLFNKNKTTLIQYPLGNDRTSYIIPSSVTTISEEAFNGCNKLTNITIPNSVTNIGNQAFAQCSRLTNINIPDSITCIGKSTFSYCKSLTNIIIPDSVAIIDNYAFYKCIGLTSVIIPDSVTSIGNHAFDYCTGLKDITISNNVTDIEEAFMNCVSLKNVTLPKSITVIGTSAFEGCTNLTSIVIPDGVKVINMKSFYKCSSLSSIIIPDSVTYIYYSAFQYCDFLGNIYYTGTESEWRNISIANGNDPIDKATIQYNWVDNTKEKLSSCTISLPTATQYFRGTRIRPVVTIKDGTKVLKSGTDYTVSYTNNLSVGKATVTITGKGDYKGTVTKNFNIVQRSIGNCDVELGAANYYFNGTRIKPSVKVYCNGTEMYSGNYTVAYSNNLSAGTATITLTGKKNLKGTVTKTLKINPRNIANCTISLTKNSANKYQPNVAVKIGSTSVYNGNYTVKYTTSADKKTVKVTLTGKGNLAGTVTKTYTV